MARNGSNAILQKAKRAKSDEFYTRLNDIERELQHYKHLFKDKVVYCNCDDPRTSNFFKFFIEHFNELKLKRLISSCYKPQSNSLFVSDKGERGFFFEYSEEEEKGKQPDFTKITLFKGDGDFRSSESIELLKQSDIVVTNPPFSLFREYVAQLIKYNKQFLIIGNINAITYKEIFRLIKDNKAWLGVNLGRGISGFTVPQHYELYGTEVGTDEAGNKIISSNNCLWLTNMQTPKRCEDLFLSKKYTGHENEYQRYDNYNAININKTCDIPSDYKGVMGVPITFLHKFNPNQFEIIKFRKGDDGRDLSINGKCPYFRILIRNKRLQGCE